MSQDLVEKKVTDEVLINLRKIIQMIDIHSRFLVRQVGLTGPQLTILQEVSKCGEISTGELAKAISLSQATVTGIIERLDKKGLITRNRSDRDRRKVMIGVTDKCLQILEKAPPPLQQSFVNAFHELQEWEQSMILSSLQRLVVMMDAKQLDAAPLLATGPVNSCEE
ncbi:MarR family winged helix-turn-helix transcriptional regulator [Desulforhopalus singaporensis]|uniref:Transcriptional regulator, MarR family n=1 Tax=Desulforhopalus singaporensis TaxID=91360 RepID=A0A1H0VH54_9BACT|nr:MarR family winged helix-turn-helix transcriptional regulator [Desulforhopalus singaporensis]SDP77693.1 transcriptional regulator, MarR family [Desulforhopalus singaporensis]